MSVEEIESLSEQLVHAKNKRDTIDRINAYSYRKANKEVIRIERKLQEALEE